MEKIKVLKEKYSEVVFNISAFAVLGAIMLIGHSISEEAQKPNSEIEQILEGNGFENPVIVETTHYPLAISKCGAEALLHYTVSFQGPDHIESVELCHMSEESLVTAHTD